MTTTQRRRPRTLIWMHVNEPLKLRRARKNRRLSQVQLAALVGCSQQYISLLERGEDRDCSEKVAERICRYLDIDLEDYFTEHHVVYDPRVATVTRDNSDAAPAARGGVGTRDRGVA